MAIEVTTGRVEYLKIAGGHGFVSIRIENNTGSANPVSAPDPPTELLIIWFGNQSLIPRTLITNELSRALAHGLRVRLTHQEDSAYISQLVIDAPFEGSLL